ncbi:telomere length regulation protein [Pseudoscourfieldia marina]
MADTDAAVAVDVARHLLQYVHAPPSARAARGSLDDVIRDIMTPATSTSTSTSEEVFDFGSATSQKTQIIANALIEAVHIASESASAASPTSGAACPLATSMLDKTIKALKPWSVLNIVATSQTHPTTQNVIRTTFVDADGARETVEYFAATQAAAARGEAALAALPDRMGQDAEDVAQRIAEQVLAAAATNDKAPALAGRILARIARRGYVAAVVTPLLMQAAVTGETKAWLCDTTMALLEDANLGARILAAAMHVADERAEANEASSLRDDDDEHKLLPSGARAICRIFAACPSRACRVLEMGALYRLNDAEHAPGRAIAWAADLLRKHGDSDTLRRLATAWQPRGNQSPTGVAIGVPATARLGTDARAREIRLSRVLVRMIAESGDETQSVASALLMGVSHRLASVDPWERHAAFQVGRALAARLAHDGIGGDTAERGANSLFAEELADLVESSPDVVEEWNGRRPTVRVSMAPAPLAKASTTAQATPLATSNEDAEEGDSDDESDYDDDPSGEGGDASSSPQTPFAALLRRHWEHNGSSDESDDDDAFERRGHEIEGESEAERARRVAPRDIAAMVAAIRKGSDASGGAEALSAAERALEEADAMIRGRPRGLKNRAADVAAALLHCRCPDAEDESDGGYEGMRLRALTGIIEMHPARALRETSMKLFGPHLDSHQRCIVLEAVAQAALAMSGKRIEDSSSPASSSASSKATRVADNEATEATTAAKHGAGRTRVFAPASLRRLRNGGREPVITRNRFAAHWEQFVLPLLYTYDGRGLPHGDGIKLLRPRSSTRSGSSASDAPLLEDVDNTHIVLSALLRTLAVCARASGGDAGRSEAAGPVSSALLRFLLAESSGLFAHREPGIRLGALVCLGEVLSALPATSLAGWMLEAERDPMHPPAEARALEHLRSEALRLTESSEEREPRVREVASMCVKLQAHVAAGAQKELLLTSSSSGSGGRKSAVGDVRTPHEVLFGEGRDVVLTGAPDLLASGSGLLLPGGRRVQS